MTYNDRRNVGSSEMRKPSILMSFIAAAYLGTWTYDIAKVNGMEFWFFGGLMLGVLAFSVGEKFTTAIDKEIEHLENEDE